MKCETYEKEKTRKINTPTDERKECSSGVLFFNSDRQSVQNEPQHALSSPFIGAKKRAEKFPPIRVGKRKPYDLDQIVEHGETSSRLTP